MLTPVVGNPNEQNPDRYADPVAENNEANMEDGDLMRMNPTAGVLTVHQESIHVIRNPNPSGRNPHAFIVGNPSFTVPSTLVNLNGTGVYTNPRPQPRSFAKAVSGERTLDLSSLPGLVTKEASQGL
ncbi:hypothetical protein NE237_008551 [Protea cynaroides]|uniref:Uncharacterized protein n=1 Tax=Protea cynaroides TaxID=273540 RepID=A0A9Q0KW31_9MAGN|nr:hypothetical protein NE237_008551 [Protea cynaroides]